MSRSSVTRELSLTIWGLFVALLLLLCALGYTAMRLAADRLVPILAQQTVALQAQAGQAIFQQAEQSVQSLRDELLQRLEAQQPDAVSRRFSSLFVRSQDGLWRLRSAQLDTLRAPTLYLRHGPNGPDDSVRRRAVASYELLRERGPALVPPFFSVYMDFVEDGLMVYARGIDWGGSADAQASNAAYPTMTGSQPARNPQRKRFWTPVYYDEQAKAWMVSVIQPLDWRGQWVGTLGHDITIDTLLDAVQSRSAEGGTQLILGNAGELIAHPELRERIAAAQGQLQIASLQDPLLSQVQALLGQQSADSGVGRTGDGSHWVAWSRIQGPGWYRVMVLPQSRVDGVLMWGLAILFGIGLLGMLPVLWFMRRRVHGLIRQPLQQLTRAVDEFGQGRTPMPIALAERNELGRLARAFDAMVAERDQQRALQLRHARELQGEVDERRLAETRVRDLNQALEKRVSELKVADDSRRQHLNGLEEERARLLALLGAMNLGIMFVTADNQVKYYNPTFLRIWMIPEDLELVGHSANEVLDYSSNELSRPDHFSRHLLDVLETHEVSSSYEITMSDGRVVTQLSYPVRDADGRFIGRLWVYEDVTRERQTAEQLIYLAERDALTGLFNRRRFEDELGRFLKESERHQRQGALLFFDLDEFKYINDTFGHRAGDSVLIRVAGEVGALTRKNEIFSRLGGDEFAVLMPDASETDAERLAERIVRAVSQIPFRLEGQNFRLTTSLGIAHYPKDAGGAEELIAHADAAMYQAKETGKNAWCSYRPERDASREMITRLTWNDRIARAFEQDLFRLHYQGIYHASGGGLSHLEALIRMVDETDPTRLIMPGHFIAYAEKSGKILEIDRWVVKHGIAMLAASPQVPALAINISGRSFDQPDFPLYIAQQLQQQGVAAHRLIVELTETSAVSDLQDAERFIEALRRTGCSTCLDDFGTGFASFAYLKHLKADVLKIDGLFIRDLPNERDNQVFVKSIVDVARGLGKRTVAEFVEDEETLRMLRQMGVDMVQGYYLDKPQERHPALDP